MPLKLVPGVKVLVSTVNTVTSAWYVMGRAACLLHNPPASVHIVLARELRFPANIKTDARYVVGLVGLMSIRARPPYDDRGHALTK